MYHVTLQPSPHVKVEDLFVNVQKRPLKNNDRIQRPIVVRSSFFWQLVVAWRQYSSGSTICMGSTVGDEALPSLMLVKKAIPHRLNRTAVSNADAFNFFVFQWQFLNTGYSNKICEE